MVTRYGMDEKLGSITYDEPVGLLGIPVPAPRVHPYSEQTAREIDCAIRPPRRNAGVLAQPATGRGAVPQQLVHDRGAGHRWGGTSLAASPSRD
jgi:hypothetical protein